MKKYLEYKDQCNGFVVRVNNRFYWDKELCMFFKAKSIVVFDHEGRIKTIGHLTKQGA